jgi:hypothetical protein
MYGGSGRTPLSSTGVSYREPRRAIHRVTPRDECDRAVDPSRCADPHLSARLHQATPLAAPEFLEEQQFDRAVIGEAARGEHPRVVQHQEVAGLNESWQLSKRAMLDLPFLAMQHHHARILAARERALRDQLLRKRVIVISQPRAHGRF